MDIDQDFVEKLKTDDMEAWKDIVEAYYKQLILFCHRYAEEPDLAQDIANSAFVKAKENIGKFDFQKYSQFRPWLWQIAKNIALDSIKKRKPEKREEKRESDSMLTITQTMLEGIEPGPGPITHAFKNERYTILFSCLEQIDEKFSEVLLLHYMDRMRRKEIAQFLEIPENTVKSRLRLALEKLRSALPSDIYANIQ